ncbi:TPA: aminopeptidase PepB [Haemophilus influenzae]|uniref:aminopeptidase PepB n=1 Tax=Haemophilus influenzae TaxID=727 RepID=UPI0005AF1470|nr:aminopeptidase PepB [Haemophilus influenzae]AJO87865.1 Peptidase B [Haemophilus influenzae]AXP76991.1 aminopeptidase PepB [Haemophilus influenzae]KIP39104.1 aminopeptidase B [Haemophilus influenzae]KIP40082.1 aminopeptidase B [Haemophilus influenzae]KIP45145.1 aminopeptidase B [Haemophilus influenzae]
MQITLSNNLANDAWGKNAILSFDSNKATIHLKNNEKTDRTLVQQAARKLRGQGIKNVELVGEEWDLEFCWAFYQGFYTAKQDDGIEFPHLDDEPQDELLARIECGDFVRGIINEPAQSLTPVKLAERAAEFILNQADIYNEKSAVSFKIISGEELEQQGYHGIWTVGKGSANLPAMLQLDFNPAQDPNAPVLACLVGKGITFDSGGYSIKPSDGMSTMRTDMGGAALLTGALGFAIARGLNQRVKLYLCCAENLISNNAFKLGDIITYKNGVTAEVLNTDAEGRLVLADGLIEADSQNPNFIIDCATLTGAAKMAVGNDYHSVLSMDDDLVKNLFQSAQEENEPFWRLPFEDFHRSQINSSFADIANIGSVPVGAGASTATAFLSYFIKNYQQNWLHIDCSATYRKSGSDLWAVGATGIGVQTLANLMLSKSLK